MGHVRFGRRVGWGGPVSRGKPAKRHAIGVRSSAAPGMLRHWPFHWRSPRCGWLRARLCGLAGLVAVASCDRRVGQCNDLVERLNPHTTAMAAAVEGLARVESDLGTLDALGDAIDRADHELAVIQLEDERLAGLGLRYRRQLLDARAAADAMRRAVAEDDVAGLNAAAKQADAFLDAQTAILDELNHYCAGG